MSYIVETQNAWKTGTEKKIDENKFAADLAKELGGTVETNTHQNDSVYIVVGSDKLFVRADNWKKRINVSIAVAEQKWGDYDAGRDAQKCESATVNPEARSIESIAKDIKKRVIDANQPALAARRQYVADKLASANSVAKLASELQAAGLRVDLNRDGQGANISTKGVYLSARLESYGKVSIDRVESVSVAKFLKIVKILQEAN